MLRKKSATRCALGCGEHTKELGSGIVGSSRADALWLGRRLLSPATQHGRGCQEKARAWCIVRGRSAPPGAHVAKRHHCQLACLKTARGAKDVGESGCGRGVRSGRLAAHGMMREGLPLGARLCHLETPGCDRIRVHRGNTRRLKHLPPRTGQASG